MKKIELYSAIKLLEQKGLMFFQLVYCGMMGMEFNQYTRHSNGQVTEECSRFLELQELMYDTRSHYSLFNKRLVDINISSDTDPLKVIGYGEIVNGKKGSQFIEDERTGPFFAGWVYDENILATSEVDEQKIIVEMRNLFKNNAREYYSLIDLFCKEYYPGYVEELRRIRSLFIHDRERISKNNQLKGFKGYIASEILKSVGKKICTGEKVEVDWFEIRNLKLREYRNGPFEKIKNSDKLRARILSGVSPNIVIKNARSNDHITQCFFAIYHKFDNNKTYFSFCKELIGEKYLSFLEELIGEKALTEAQKIEFQDEVSDKITNSFVRILSEYITPEIANDFANSELEPGNYNMIVAKMKGISPNLDLYVQEVLNEYGEKKV